MPYISPMSSRFDTLPNRRAIIDRRVIAEELAAIDINDAGQLRRAATALLKEALETGRAEIAQRLIDRPSRGLEAANACLLYTSPSPRDS